MAVLRASSIQYRLVVVVVCLPVLSTREISLVAACAPGTSRLISVLLPTPEAEHKAALALQQIHEGFFLLRVIAGQVQRDDRVARAAIRVQDAAVSLQSLPGHGKGSSRSYLLSAMMG